MATEHDSVDTGALATLVVVGVFAILGVALGVDALYRNEVSKVGSERADGASHEVDELVTGQRAALDAQPLPIDRAMSAVVLDLQRNPWSATPPMPDKDAGADAAAEGEDAGADAAVELDASGQPIEPAPAGEPPREPGAPPNEPPPPQREARTRLAAPPLLTGSRRPGVCAPPLWGKSHRPTHHGGAQYEDPTRVAVRV
jgi:hypothetical protein